MMSTASDRNQPSPRSIRGSDCRRSSYYYPIVSLLPLLFLVMQAKQATSLRSSSSQFLGTPGRVLSSFMAAPTSSSAHHRPCGFQGLSAGLMRPMLSTTLSAHHHGDHHQHSPPDVTLSHHRHQPNTHRWIEALTWAPWTKKGASVADSANHRLRYQQSQQTASPASSSSTSVVVGPTALSASSRSFWPIRTWTSAVAALVLVVVAAAFPWTALALDFGPTLPPVATAWLASWKETGFYEAFSLVFLSEIGDKTFFIAGLLAMKTSRFISFAGSIAALGVMTLISVLIGQIFHVVPSGFADGLPLDDIAAVAAFAFFGIKTLKEAIEMDSDSKVMEEEMAEAEEAVEGSGTGQAVTGWGQIASIFALVFAAEFGDRSFLSTIALSAAQNPLSVAGGAIAAHALATGIAVSGGSYVAKFISEKVIGLIGGTLFIVFAITTALGIF